MNNQPPLVSPAVRLLTVGVTLAVALVVSCWPLVVSPPSSSPVAEPVLELLSGGEKLRCIGSVAELSIGAASQAGPELVPRQPPPAFHQSQKAAQHQYLDVAVGLRGAIASHQGPKRPHALRGPCRSCLSPK
jgi:hypothetical protein